MVFKKTLSRLPVSGKICLNKPRCANRIRPMLTNRCAHQQSMQLKHDAQLTDRWVSTFDSAGFSNSFIMREWIVLTCRRAFNSGYSSRRETISSRVTKLDSLSTTCVSKLIQYWIYNTMLCTHHSSESVTAKSVRFRTSLPDSSASTAASPKKDPYQWHATLTKES